MSAPSLRYDDARLRYARLTVADDTDSEWRPLLGAAVSHGPRTEDPVSSGKDGQLLTQSSGWLGEQRSGSTRGDVLIADSLVDDA